MNISEANMIEELEHEVSNLWNMLSDHVNNQGPGKSAKNLFDVKNMGWLIHEI